VFFNILVKDCHFLDSDFLDSDSEPEEVNPHKERMFDLFMKTRGEKTGRGPAGSGKLVRQTALSSFFKRKHKEM